MADTHAAMFDIATLNDLLRAARDGFTEVLGALVERPLLVVDLDTPGELDGIDRHPLLPGVIVGASRTGAVDGPLDGVDVALTGATDPTAPWVSVTDLDAGVEQVVAAVSASPRVSVLLAQVLRSGRPDSIDHDLVIESLAYSTLQGGSEFRRWLNSRPATSARPDVGATVIVDRLDDRLSITLNRPRVRNAYDAAMRDELCEALRMVGADPSIIGVDLMGSGPDFCSGGDLNEFGTATDPATSHLIRTARSAARLLGTVGDRVAAHLHGACIGAGIELPAAAGRVIAEPDTRIQLPEVAMGLIPGAGGTATLPRRIGRQRTAWMALTGRDIDAETALAWNLVDEINRP
ncbi:MAG TPA: enoyl-CoA hydratase/isomerase family protein [Acidimicrobiales bacterium]|nr:enoyl-CoA hydratase/isomerase family protein [Acidimicrobiales bacterium]HVB93298.1 enoyl-CoA hydratase/isomerase family protein [Acidimicrobiales bacterium]